MDPGPEEAFIMDVGYNNLVSSGWTSLYLELGWMISTVLTCSELSTLTALLKVRNTDPFKKKNQEQEDLSDLQGVIFYDFKESSANKTEWLDRTDFSQIQFKSILMKK